MKPEEQKTLKHVLMWVGLVAYRSLAPIDCGGRYRIFWYGLAFGNSSEVALG